MFKPNNKRTEVIRVGYKSALSTCIHGTGAGRNGRESRERPISPERDKKAKITSYFDCNRVFV